MLLESSTAHLGLTCSPETQEQSGRHHSATILPLEGMAEQQVEQIGIGENGQELSWLF